MKSKRVLAVLSEYGYWGVELTGPQKELERVGYGLDYVTPNGRRPHALPPSYDPTYVDPPLNYNVTPPEIAEQVKTFDSGPALDHPLSLATNDPAAALSAGRISCARGRAITAARWRRSARRSASMMPCCSSVAVGPS